MQFGSNGADRINSFALVSYIDGPLGSFLDALRRELAPLCMARAHVSILPPRPLQVSPATAWEQIQRQSGQFSPFTLETTAVEVFPVTAVIYLALGAGRETLERMHVALNTGGLAFAEPFRYHPHVTLAQELPLESVEKATELARRRWADFSERRSFTVGTMTFVQNTTANRWLDLGECALLPSGASRTS
jgi:2'-5' RNA ligase